LAADEVLEITGKRFLEPISGKRERSFQQSHRFSPSNQERSNPSEKMEKYILRRHRESRRKFAECGIQNGD
jgi:hypothetical protein